MTTTPSKLACGIKDDIHRMDFGNVKVHAKVGLEEISQE